MIPGSDSAMSFVAHPSGPAHITDWFNSTSLVNLAIDHGYNRTTLP
jgi:hypothetical protein